MKSSSYNHKRSVTVGRKCIQYVQLYNTLIYHVLHFAAGLKLMMIHYQSPSCLRIFPVYDKSTRRL